MALAWNMNLDLPFQIVPFVLLVSWLHRQSGETAFEALYRIKEYRRCRCASSVVDCCFVLGLAVYKVMTFKSRGYINIDRAYYLDPSTTMAT
jgi:hypothetical protein